MFHHNISRDVYVDIAMAPVAAGTGDTQSGIVIDTSGFEAILFVVYIGTITSTGTATIQVQYGNASNGGDMANVPVPPSGYPETYNIVGSSAVAVPTTGENLGYLSVELHRPTKRYARVQVIRATANVVINGAIVLMARDAFLPPAQGANMGNVTPQVIVSP